MMLLAIVVGHGGRRPSQSRVEEGGSETCADLALLLCRHRHSIPTRYR